MERKSISYQGGNIVFIVHQEVGVGMSYEWFDFFNPRGILDFKEKKTLRKKQNEFFLNI